MYDAEKDERKTLKVKNGKVALALNAYESLFLIISDELLEKDDGIYVLPNEKEFDKNLYGNFDLTYKPNGMKKAIETWQLTTRKNGVETFNGQIKWARLRDVLGSQDDIYKDRYKVPFFDRAPRIESIYPQKAIFSVEIDCENKTDYILFDKWTFSGDYTIYFNGEEINKSEFYKKRIYDKSNVAFNPKWKEGKNKIDVVFNDAQEFDGINGELYVMKNLE